jgi:hypothetical protein
VVAALRGQRGEPGRHLRGLGHQGEGQTVRQLVLHAADQPGEQAGGRSRHGPIETVEDQHPDAAARPERARARLYRGERQVVERQHVGEGGRVRGSRAGNHDPDVPGRRAGRGQHRREGSRVLPCSDHDPAVLGSGAQDGRGVVGDDHTARWDRRQRGPDRTGRCGRQLKHVPLQHLPQSGRGRRDGRRCPVRLHRHGDRRGVGVLLDYDLQRFGPDGPQAAAAAREIDMAMAPLLAEATAGATTVVLSEYGITNVARPVDINRALRRAGLLEVYTQAGMEYLAPWTSRAFAVADHQIAHVYVKDPADLARARSVLGELAGVDQVLDATGKAHHGLDHERAGELVAVAAPDAWFT